MRISDWSSDVCSSDLGTNGTVIAQRTNRDRLPRTGEQRGRWPCPSALVLRRKAGRSDAAAHPTHGAGGARQHGGGRIAAIAFGIFSTVEMMLEWPVVEIGRASCRERGC